MIVDSFRKVLVSSLGIDYRYYGDEVLVIKTVDGDEFICASAFFHESVTVEKVFLAVNEGELMALVEHSYYSIVYGDTTTAKDWYPIVPFMDYLVLNGALL